MTGQVGLLLCWTFSAHECGSTICIGLVIMASTLRCGRSGRVSNLLKLLLQLLRLLFSVLHLVFEILYGFGLLGRVVAQNSQLLTHLYRPNKPISLFSVVVLPFNSSFNRWAFSVNSSFATISFSMQPCQSLSIFFLDGEDLPRITFLSMVLLSLTSRSEREEVAALL